MTIKQKQRQLKFLGFYGGEIDISACYYPVCLNNNKSTILNGGALIKYNTI